MVTFYDGLRWSGPSPSRRWRFARDPGLFPGGQAAHHPGLAGTRGAGAPDSSCLGAASGTLGGYLTDIGIDDKWMKETAAAIPPGTAALFVLVRKVTADKVLEGLRGEGGTVMKTSLDHTKEAALQAALAGVQSIAPVSAADLHQV